MRTIIKNPARARPLSANVKRLMTMERESPQNPDVEKVQRAFNERDLAYCDMQGCIFMAAVDRGVSMDDFASLYMTSQLAGVIDHSFSVAGGMEKDDVSNLLQMPMLLKSPDVIADVAIWLNNIVSKTPEEESASMAVAQACAGEEEIRPVWAGETTEDLDKLTDEYEYAYWLGFIYRYECLLHDESSRMVYGAFSQKFMKEIYDQTYSNERTLMNSAAEICETLDKLLIGKLWKKVK